MELDITEKPIVPSTYYGIKDIEKAITSSIDISLLDKEEILQYIHRINNTTISPDLSKEELYSIARIEQEFLKWGQQYAYSLVKALRYITEQEDEKIDRYSEEKKHKELEYIIKIQRLWRGHVSRKQFNLMLVELVSKEIIIPSYIDDILEQY